jgi:hypothetical protein
MPRAAHLILDAQDCPVPDSAIMTDQTKIETDEVTADEYEEATGRADHEEERERYDRNRFDYSMYTE